MARTKSVQATYDAFGAHYDAMMRDPAESSWNRVLERPAMAALLRKSVRGKSVADIGCGSGIFTNILRKWGAKSVVGVDFSKTLLGIARKSYPPIAFQYGTAAKTGLKTGEFDIVTSSMMLHYLKNIDAHFREVRRILKRGGTYVFSCHHPLFQAYGGDPFRENVPARDVQYLANYPYQWKMMKKLHLHGYCHTFEQLSESLTKEGFIVEKIREPIWKKKRGSRLPDEYMLISHFPPFLIVQARKI
ncbi:MAG: class I SAM-dependent methyltransferase [Candidatus Peregrinibacteria bacterium]|nr:class I SAM-dependent methyltransferase [Candidatus Peregrinibacteria bacterium]